MDRRDDDLRGTEEFYDSEDLFQRDDYTDAHYEPVGESTVPPRYYTPHERTARMPNAEFRKKSGKAAALLCAVLLSALAGGLLGSVLTAYRMSDRLDRMEVSLREHLESTSQTAESGGPASPADALAAQDGRLLSPSDIYDRAKDEVVGIRTEFTVTNFFGMTSSGAVNGTGFIVSPDGYILTNYHVVEDAWERRLNVDVFAFDGTKYSASIVGTEPANDIAVLKIDADGLPAAELGDSDLLRVGDPVYAVGNPLGELEFSMSTGYVSALDREISTQEHEAINMFQLDAAVNEGNSGGPVYDAEGKVVGIVTAKYSSSGVEGLGFAIPVNDARGIAQDLITKGYVTGKASLGVSIASGYNAMYAQYYGTPLGAYLAEIIPGSAAEKAGLQQGDIVLAIGEYAVSDYSDLKNALRHFSAGDESSVKIYRAGEELQIPIVFDEQRPE